MNSTCLVGRLTRDPEMRVTPSGASVCSFSLAVDRAGDKQDDGSYAAGFFDCEAWNKTADMIGQYFSKGKQIAVEGRLKHHRWQAQDGANKSKVEIIVSGFTFIGSKSDDDGEAAPAAATDADFQGADDDIPF